jgi:hypothetical protein
MILKLWQMMNRTMMSKRTCTMCISLERNRNYYHSFGTLTRSVVCLILFRNDLEALADDEEDRNMQENLDHVRLLEEKEKLLLFL